MTKTMMIVGAKGGEWGCNDDKGNGDRDRGGSKGIASINNKVEEDVNVMVVVVGMVLTMRSLKNIGSHSLNPMKFL